ncbi:MAG: rubrerythrin [Bacillota bacterium]
MPNIKGTETEKNLLKAFIGESQARNKYDYFASQAKKEGYNQIAEIFKETARNEKEHAKRIFKFLEGGEVEVTDSHPAGVIGSTAENLKAAAEGENYEHTSMYPSFAKTARKEGFNEIADALEHIAQAEEAHEARYLKLLDNLKDNKVFSRDEEVTWKCDNCGYVHEGTEAPQKCPACDHPQEYFELKEKNY